jgi:hypothetical protein
MRKALKVFLRWRVGEAKALALAGWLYTRDRQKTPDYLKEQEIEFLYRKCRTAEQRFVVAMLFDSGARAEEFINIRFEDVHLPDDKENFVKLTLKEEYSKTKGRTISLYWKNSLLAVSEFVQERIQQGIRPDEPVFTGSYDAMRMFLHRLGQSALKRSVHPHLFRHSSATFYATKLNRQELCYRYGWKFSSDMPDVYISRAGMESKELDVKFTRTQLGSVEEHLAQVEHSSKLKDDKIRQLSEQLLSLQTNLAAINEVLALKPSITEIEKAIDRKR